MVIPPVNLSEMIAVDCESNVEEHSYKCTLVAYL